ncbi:MAG: aconitate hydratase B, partial [Candidatus Azotimanducaceae bacterium]
MLDRYREHVAERAAQGISPKPLTDEEVNELVALLKEPPTDEEELILDLITNRVPAGVDNAAYVKAAFLTDIAKNNTTSPLINRQRATELLGTMLGGYNIEPLIELLDDEEVADKAVEALSRTLLMFDFRIDLIEKAKTNKYAATVLQSWADA